MGHTLYPINKGPYLEPDEIARRLGTEFKFVHTDRELASKSIRESVSRFEKWGPELAKALEKMGTSLPTLITAHREAIGKSLWITVSDRRDFQNDYLQFLAKPGDSLLIGYKSGYHEDEAAPLLKRVCSVLGYERVLI